MQTLNDFTVEHLEVIQTELNNFFNTSAYQTLIEVLNGKSAVLEKEVITTRPGSLVDIFNREAMIGEAREAARQIDFFQEFSDEVSDVLKAKQAPSHQ
jgi:hypothetical protein